MRSVMKNKTNNDRNKDVFLLVSYIGVSGSCREKIEREVLILVSF